MSILDRVNSNLSDISPYSPGKPIEDVARELGLDPNGILKLASNENALGTSPMAAKAMTACVTNSYRYPDGAAFELRTKLATKYAVDFDQIIVSNGSNEILELVGHCLLNPDSSVVFSAHSFVVYRLVAQLFGARIIEVPMDGNLVHDIDRMTRSIDEDTSVIFICNPNNPTGTMITSDQLYAAIERVPDDVLIVIDEAYAEVALAQMPDTLRYVNSKQNLLVCRTFSKGYGLAGLRLGYGIGPASLIAFLQKTRQPFNVNFMAQVAGVAALDDIDFLEESRQLCFREREFVESGCRDLNLNFVRTSTNFMLIEVGNGAEITEALMKKGVIVRSMGTYDLNQYIRLTFGRREENARFVAELRQLVA